MSGSPQRSDYPTVTVAEVTALGSAAAPWRFVPGVAAPVQEFDVMPTDATQVLRGQAIPFNLVMDNGKRTTVQNLIAIARGASADPNLARLRVTDRRFAWPYIHVGPRRYNMRRKVGNKRLDNPQNVREVAQLVDRIRYHPASLTEGGSTWTARAILEDVLTFIVSQDETFRMGAGDFTIDLTEIDALPIENLELDDSADKALARVLAYLPGAEVTVDDDGSIRVYSTLDGSERATLESAGPESVGLGHVEWIDNHRIRPGRIVVLFEREAEVRFNFYEGDDTGTSGDGRFLQNVLPVPDYSLTLLGGRTVPQGTWVPIEQCLDAWNANSPLPGFPDFNLSALRRAMVPYMDAWAGLRLAGSLSPNADWMARLSALVQHYRQTYRINPRWIDRIRDLKAERIATMDVATGTRGASPVFADYCYIASQRAGFLAKTQGAEIPYAMNVARYPSDGAITSETVPAAASVSILDRDQGIIRFDFKPDLLRVYEMVLPSQIETSGAGTQPGTQATQPGPMEDYTGPESTPITFDSIREGGTDSTLTTSYRAATILTALPAYPNTESILHRVTVTPKDVKSCLPPAFQGQLDHADGPTLYVKIGANVATALVAWTDATSELTEQAFGVGKPGGGDLTSALEPITLNSKPQQDIGDRAASLQAVAYAAAAAAWSAYADYPMGSLEVPMNGDLKLSGFLGSISHVVEPDGRAVTRVECRGPRVGVSMFAYLDANTRALVMKLART